MPDIYKCKGEDCDIRDMCWRYTSPDCGERQSYIEPCRWKPKAGSWCYHYWPTEPKENPKP